MYSGEAPLRPPGIFIGDIGVGTFRVIYRVMRNIIEIVAIGPRERIYEETYRLPKRETR